MTVCTESPPCPLPLLTPCPRHYIVFHTNPTRQHPITTNSKFSLFFNMHFISVGFNSEKNIFWTCPSCQVYMKQQRFGWYGNCLAYKHLETGEVPYHQKRCVVACTLDTLSLSYNTSNQSFFRELLHY